MFKRMRKGSRRLTSPKRGPNFAARRRLPKKIPSQSAVAAIIAALPDCDTQITLRNRLMVELAYGSGMRRGEIVGIDIEDLDLTAKTARVTGKGRKVRIVPLTDKSIDLLRRLLSLRHACRGPLIISMNTGQRLAIRHVSKLFKRLTGHNTHRFRHACATHLLQNGCNLRHIQALLGHADLATTEIYTAVDKTHLAQVVAVNHPRALST